MILGTLYEQTWISLPQISMHSSQWFMRSRFLKILSKFSLFCPLLGPKTGHPLYMNKSESPSPKHISYQLLLKLASWFLRRRLFNRDVIRQSLTKRKTPHPLQKMWFFWHIGSNVISFVFRNFNQKGTESAVDRKSVV